MMNELKNTIERVNNMQTTENGAVGYSTSGQYLVDLNFRIPSRHNNVNLNDLHTFEKSMCEDPINTVKWMFYLRDVREGLGERDSFINFFVHLNTKYPELATKLLPLIPEYGRWKDVVDILKVSADGTNIANSILEMIKNQIMVDCKDCTDGKSVSLLAKWLPSVNSTANSRIVAKRICKYLGIKFADYRKILSKLRSYIDITEVKTCGNRWNEIDYNKVSSNANSRYIKAFMKHDEERRQEYINSLSKEGSGSVMHASNLYPHEVYAKYAQIGKVICEYNRYNNVDVDPSIEALWNNLKNIETMGNTLVVCDGSGSMQVTIGGSSTIHAIDVSRSLSVFFAERNTGEFKNKVIEFSGTPRYIDLSGCNTLADKFNVMKNYHTDAPNTDIEKVFNLVLQTAIQNNLPQDELPSQILIVSDMEFDEATTCNGAKSFNRMYQTLFDNIKDSWKSAGYKMPKLIFWNVSSKTQTFPVRSNETGTVLVSGYSVNNAKVVLSGMCDPWKSLKEILNSERYDVIANVINS